MFLYIVAFVGDGWVAYVDWSDIEGIDLKLYFNKF
jgi:hypothetical protein